MRVVCVILAAGRGERLGGAKALLKWPTAADERAPLALVHARARMGVDCESVLIVTRESMAAILRRHRVNAHCHLVVSNAPDDHGPAGSLAAALPTLDGLRPGLAEADAVLVSPVDCLPASPALVGALIDALKCGGPNALAVRPRCAGRGGHPVLLRPGALEAYRHVSPPPLRDVLRSLGSQLVELSTEDERVRYDVDTPQDYARHTGDEQPPQFFTALSPSSSRVDDGFYAGG